MKVIETERLILREVISSDAEFILDLLNQRSFKKFIGLCGFVKRDTLPNFDIGFALLPQLEKSGYAYESAVAVMRYGRETLRLPRVVAITTVNNYSPGKLLKKFGFEFDREIEIGDEVLKIFSGEL